MSRKIAKKQTKEASFNVISPDVIYGDHGIPQPKPYSDYEDAYGVHPWIYACVRAIATNLAGIEILPYVQNKAKDGWEVDEKHELFPLLKRPNAYMSGFNLREYTAAALKLSGNAYWWLETNGGTKIEEIWPIIPSNMFPVSTKERLIDHYIYRVNGKQIVMPYERVIHFRGMNPSSFIFGQGSLQSVTTAVATDIYAQVWNRAFFQNHAMPAAVLQTDGEVEGAMRTRILESWRQLYGSPGKRGKVGILEGGLTVQKIDESTKDMDFINLRKQLCIEILAAFGVPPSIVGLLEYANYSNMEQQYKSFWTNTLMPELRNIEQTLTMRAEEICVRSGVTFQGDTSKVEALRPDMKMMADTTQIFVNAGVPINQIIEALDLPFEPVEGGDKPRLPAPAFGAPAAEEEEEAPPKPAKGVKQVKDEAALEAQWKSIDGRVREHEGKMLAAMRTFFKGQARRVQANLEKHRQAILNAKQLHPDTFLERLKALLVGDRKDLADTVNLLIDVDNEEQIMSRAAERIIRGTYFDFAVSMARQLDPDFDFSLQDPYAVAWIRRQTLQLVRQTTAFTRETLTQEVVDAVQEALANGYSESETVAQIADRITEVYEFAQASRAENIAQTETAGAANAGAHDGMKKTGTEKKGWLSARDSNVRDTHRELEDAGPVGIDEPFISSSGAQLMFPGDPAAPASERCRCRCALIAR